ncbi:hypothetical protein [Bosea sp. (in: a-proteobacteria)]
MLAALPGSTFASRLRAGSAIAQDYVARTSASDQFCMLLVAAYLALS